MKKKNPFSLDVVSVRLVKDAPLMSGHPILKPADAVELLGRYLCEMDREVLCVINLKTDGTPINSDPRTVIIQLIENIYLNKKIF